MAKRRIPTNVELLWDGVGAAAALPERFEALRVLADAYRDADDWHRADACDWIARSELAPYDWSKNENGLKGFDWCSDTSIANWEVPAHCVVPFRLQALLAEDVPENWHAYKNPLDAYHGLVEAYATAAGEGWEPEDEPATAHYRRKK